MALSKDAKLGITLTLKDNASAGIGKVKGSLKSLDAATSRTQGSLAKTAGNLKMLGAGLATGLVGGGIAALKIAGDFEAQLNTINTVAGKTPEGLQAIGDGIRKMARDTGASTDDLTSAYYDLVSAGVDAADAQAVLTQANTLAVGGLSTTGEAVDLLTTAMNVYGAEAKDAQKITDGFAQAIGAGKVTAAELAASFAKVAPVAASAGIEIEELQAAYAQMTAAGVPAAEASTQMRAAIVSLMNPSKSMLKLQDKLNINFAELAEQKGLAIAYQAIKQGAEGANLPLMKVLGTVEAQSFALAVTGDNAKGYSENLKLVKGASEGTGVAAKQMAERQKGLNFQLDRLKALAKDAGISIGSALLPKITPLIARLNEFVNLNQDKITGIGDKLAGLFSNANIESGSRILKSAMKGIAELPWDTIREGLRLSGDVAKKAFEAFNSLDPEMKKIIIGALAVNKLTGGLVSSVVMDLAGLALKSLTTIMAGTVTVIGKSVVGGGGGGAAPVPTGGGGGAAKGPWWGPLMGLLGPAALAATTVSRDTPVGADADNGQVLVDINRAIEQLNRDSNASSLERVRILKEAKAAIEAGDRTTANYLMGYSTDSNANTAAALARLSDLGIKVGDASAKLNSSLGIARTQDRADFAALQVTQAATGSAIALQRVQDRADLAVLKQQEVAANANLLALRNQDIATGQLIGGKVNAVNASVISARAATVAASGEQATKLALVRSGIDLVRQGVTAGSNLIDQGVAAVQGAIGGTTNAIRSKDMSTTVNVSVSTAVSVRDVQSRTRQLIRYGGRPGVD